MRRGCEVAQLGSRGHARTGHADDDAAPGAVAFRVARGVADRVLAGELVGDLAVDTGQLRKLAREERARSRFLRELAQHELRFLEPLRGRPGAVRRAQPDGIDRRLGALREIEDLFERQQAGRVLAVGEDHDRLPANLLGVLGDDLLQVLQRDVDGVVEGGRAAGRRLLDRRLELSRAVREVLQDDDAAIEVDHLGEILRPKPLRKADRGFLRRRQLGVHTGAGVEQQRQRDRQVGAVEEGDVLLDAVLENVEILGGQVGDVLPGAVADGDVERDQIDAGAERHLRRLPSRRGLIHRRRDRRQGARGEGDAAGSDRDEHDS
jgi:hypothetical protein